MAKEFIKREGSANGDDAPTGNGSWSASGSKPSWHKPKPLPDELLPVEAFDIEFLPNALGPWVADIAERLQCPVDYVAVAAVTALGSLIGRRVGIKPQRKTDWVEVPNLWGGFIGRPGLLKSPAMMEALKPLHRLEAKAVKDYEAARRTYEADLEGYKLRKSVRMQLDKEKLRGKDDGSTIELGEEPQEPTALRYRTNDSSYEAVDELLISNPAGILVERDELVSLLKHLDREEQCVARGFYLSGWSGLQPYTIDRIGRGHRHSDGICVGVLGNTQPDRIGEYVRRANAGGGGGDGLLQRFSLMVWPDLPGEWRHVDRYPNSEARDAAWKAFEDASKLDLAAVIKIGGERGQFDSVPFLRFDEEAAAKFLVWRSDLERRLRGGEMSPTLEGHLAKFRKLVPTLALINHLADGGHGAVTLLALLKALSFADYLESHARRLYAAAGTAELVAGKAILKHLQDGDLKDGFTARDVHQRGWSGLTDRDHVQVGLHLLADLDHIAETVMESKPIGGRPSITYSINPESRP
jgi:putative DNA primase/helicase